MTLLEAYVFFGLPALALGIGGVVYFVATRQLDRRAPAE
jgi:hypothetical protein